MMTESTLKQRVFDQLFHSIALMWLLSPDELEEIAASLELQRDCDIYERKTLAAMATAVRAAKEGQ